MPAESPGYVWDAIWEEGVWAVGVWDDEEPPTPDPNEGDITTMGMTISLGLGG